MNVGNIFICTLSVLLVNQVCSSSDKKIVRARVESCPGCQLNRLTEVKQFIFEDVPNYENVEFKKIPGAPPELVFLDEVDEAVERVELRNYNRKECNELLQKKGFKSTTDKKEL